jgi:hypothetical protein
MSETFEISFWHMVCVMEYCELYGISFPISENKVECGGCNTIYTKPE